MQIITLAFIALLCFTSCSNKKSSSDTSFTLVNVTGLITDISISGSTTCVVRGGYVKCWGSNSTGQLGNGTTTNSLTPQLVSGLTDITKVKTAGGKTCALNKSGQLYCWGFVDYVTNQTTPKLVDSISNITDFSIATSPHQICAISSGNVYCWGYQDSNLPITDGNVFTTITTPTLKSGITNADKIEMGSSTACARASSKLYCWGYGGNGQFGTGVTNVSSITPLDLSSYWGLTSQISLGTNKNICTISSTNSVKCAGYNSKGEVYSAPNTSIVTYINTPTSPYGFISATMVVSGDYHTCALVGTNTIKCWGDNCSDFALGINSTACQSYEPTAVYGITKNVTTIATGYSTTCASFDDETMMCWGKNDYGQIGNGNTLNQSTPVLVKGL